MRILADESVDAPVVAWLRQKGHDVVAIAEDSPGITDAQVLARAVAEQRTLVTAGRDFGDIIMRDALAAPDEGVVLYRLRSMPVSQKAERVAQVFTDRAAQVIGAFTVIERDRVRHRSLR